MLLSGTSLNRFSFKKLNRHKMKYKKSVYNCLTGISLTYLRRILAEEDQNTRLTHCIPELGFGVG